MQTEQIPVLKADEYPGGIWYYEPHTYQPVYAASIFPRVTPATTKIRMENAMENHP